MLVSFEGIDGSGKSTLIREVAKRLKKRGRKILVTREPTDSWLGRTVRRGIRTRLDPMALCGLFLADRAWHVGMLAPDLARGHFVLTDRYTDSTTAYQAAALDGTVPKPFDALRVLQRFAFPRPDLVVLLDIPPKDALKRIQGRAVKEPFEKARFLESVRKNYQELARLDASRWLVLDARRPVPELAQRVVDRVSTMA